MATQLDLPMAGDLERMGVAEFAERAYLDYAMYVVLDRALPRVADGLKPVQRRIVYAMSELGLSAASKHKKSARTVGDVIGKFHPHGDSACYEAMVLMAQPFSYRYPLVDGQGNWGAPDDPKSFAAMRYTEARLTAFAKVLLAELDQGTVDWGPNFDGTLNEPKVLPARLPHVLLNGGSGIAVGLATDIPPHNVGEVAAACIQLLENPDATLAELCEDVVGPDFPTAAEIISSPEEIREIYETGSGSVRTRAVWEREDGDVVVTALPYQVSGSKVLSQIATQMQAKKLPMVEDLRDESDHENPTRLVITPRSNRVDVQVLMDHLFATTDLERTHRVNMHAIGLDGKPHLYGLKELLREWLEFRIATVRRRLEHRLAWVEERLHVLDGLLVAFLNLDEVIRIIRTEEHPKPRLIERFDLSDRQAEAILETKLRHLARLEEMRIRGEQDELAREREELVGILGSSRRLKKLVQRELLEVAETFDDGRRSPIVAREAARALDESALVPSEPVTVVLSTRGWVRAGKGYDVDGETLSYKSGDGFLASARGRSNQQVVFLDSGGRSYSVAAHGLPSARGYGEPLSSSLDPPSGASFVSLLLGDEEELVVLASDAGYGFVVAVGELHAKNRAGKAMITLPSGARVLEPARVQDLETDLLVCATDQGRLLVFPASELPRLAKGKGLKLVHMPRSKRTGEERLVGVAAVPAGGEVRVHAGKRYTNLSGSGFDPYRGERASRGERLPRGFRNVDRLELVEPQ